MPIHLERGARNKIAFVFSCPGQREQCEGRPAAGATGDNLAEVLCLMRQGIRRLNTLSADEWTRENVWITNAWPCVEFRGLTCRTEASIREVLQQTNVSRLENELRVVQNLIVCCGRRAQRAVDRLQGLQRSVRIVTMRHLSTQSLNRWLKNTDLPENIQGDNDSQERRRMRLQCWADKLCQDLRHS